METHLLASSIYEDTDCLNNFETPGENVGAQSCINHIFFGLILTLTVKKKMKNFIILKILMKHLFSVHVENLLL